MLDHIVDWFRRKEDGSARDRLAAKAALGPLKGYYETAAPDLNVSLREAQYLVLDFETTGLDPKRHEIISAGWVVLDARVIDLSSAVHCLVKPKGEIAGQSVTIHKIFQADVVDAPDISYALDILLETLKGRVLIAHHAKTEIDFLNAACQRLYGAPFKVPVIDTLDLGVRYFKAVKDQPKPGDLRLFNLRRRFGLPAYQAHNALMDAIATAELFLAETAYLDSSKVRTVRDILSP